MARTDTRIRNPASGSSRLASRNLVSNDHYNGTVEQVQRQTLQNYVTNHQNLVDVGVSHAVNRRLALTFAMPFVNSSWASRDPAFPLPAPRHEIAQNGKGIGDISLTGRYWLFDTADPRHVEHRRGWRREVSNRQLPGAGSIPGPNGSRRTFFVTSINPFSQAMAAGD